MPKLGCRHLSSYPADISACIADNSNVSLLGDVERLGEARRRREKVAAIAGAEHWLPCSVFIPVEKIDRIDRVVYSEMVWPSSLCLQPGSREASSSCRRKVL